MASYHYTQKPVARGRGQSAVAGAAYRAGERLYDHSAGQTFDYSRRGGVAHAEIVLPAGAAKQDVNWPRNRQALWNAAEAAEKRKDARIAREHEVALPHELNQAQQIALLRAFAAEIANRYHVAVDFALHKPHRKGDARNFHAHVYSTTREITPTGLGPKAAPELSDTDRFKRGLPAGREEIKFMRARFAEIQNEHLRVHGIKARVDHRTLEAQGIDRMPTTHLGVAVWGMERRGIETRVGLRVREQQALEAQRRLERAAELGRLEREGREVTRSMLDLSADLSRALRERDRGLERAPEASAGLVPGLESEGKALPAADRLRAKADQVAQRLALEREQGRPERETAERERELARQLEREKQKQQELERDRDLGLER